MQGQQFNTNCQSGQQVNVKILYRQKILNKQRLSYKLKCSASDEFGPKNIRKLADLANIEVTDKEVEEWAPQLNGIKQWFNELNSIDVKDVPPLDLQASPLQALRADKPKQFNDRDLVMRAVPERQGDLVQVPRIRTDEEGVEGQATSSQDSEGEEEDKPELPLPSVLDIRVGKIVSVEKHPDADSLYVEQVDVGEDEPRTIVSGLVNFVPLEEMKDRRVIALLNLKPRKMRGIKSHGMLLCASPDDKSCVQPLEPPEGAAIGERAYFGDEKSQGDPLPPKKLAKKKCWEDLQPTLKTNGDKQAMCGDSLMNTSAGPVTAATLTGANIS